VNDRNDEESKKMRPTGKFVKHNPPVMITYSFATNLLLRKSICNQMTVVDPYNFDGRSSINNKRGNKYTNVPYDDDGGLSSSKGKSNDVNSILNALSKKK
jgi:hypothetical protein